MIHTLYIYIYIYIYIYVCVCVCKWTNMKNKVFDFTSSIVYWPLTRPNMPFQRRRKWIFLWPFIGRDWVGVQLLYNSVHRKFKQFGDQMSLGTRELENDAVEKTAPRGPQLKNPGERERNADGQMSGGQYVAVLFGLQLPLTHNPFK